MNSNEAAPACDQKCQYVDVGNVQEGHVPVGLCDKLCASVKHAFHDGHWCEDHPNGNTPHEAASQRNEHLTTIVTDENIDPKLGHG